MPPQNATSGNRAESFSAIIPTRNRADALRRTLESLAEQSLQPAEIVVIDASDDDTTKRLRDDPPTELLSEIRWLKAEVLGAAPQRNQGVATIKHDAIFFCDDDIIFEPECVSRLWDALQSDAKLGGVNAMITNQRYQTPGRASRTLFRILHGKPEKSYAGKCVGPALNLLPEDRDDLPEVVPVEWLNTTCCLYRREALPNPPFSDFFYGYSLMEDVTLSLTVGREWKLANARTARIFHDSQVGDHKTSARKLARMDLVNRHHVMARVLGRNRWRDYGKLALLQAFGLATSLTSPRGRRRFIPALAGKLQGMADILITRKNK